MAWIETYVTKNGIRRRVRDRRGGKKIHQRAGPLKETAYQIRTAMEDDSVRIPLNLEHHKKTISQAIDDFLTFCVNSNKSPNTVNQYRYSLEPFRKIFGDWKPKAISAQKMEEFKEGLFLTVKGGNLHKVKKFYTVNGVKIILRTVKTFFSYAKRHGYIQENPAHDTDNLDEMPVWRILTEEEQVKILEVCRPHQELWEIVLIALRTGMRENEIILKLTTDRIWDHHIHFKPRETKRNKRGRKIPIIDEILFIETKVKSGRLYPGWKRNRIIQAFTRAVARAGIGRVRFHDLKHTFCTMWLRRGGNMRELQEITGNDIKTLEKYTHFEEGELREKAQAMFRNLGANLGAATVAHGASKVWHGENDRSDFKDVHRRSIDGGDGV